MQIIYPHKHILQGREKGSNQIKCIKCEEVVSAVGKKKVLNAPGQLRREFSNETLI